MLDILGSQLTQFLGPQLAPLHQLRLVTALGTAAALQSKLAVLCEVKSLLCQSLGLDGPVSVAPLPELPEELHVAGELGGAEALQNPFDTVASCQHLSIPALFLDSETCNSAWLCENRGPVRDRFLQLEGEIMRRDAR